MKVLHILSTDKYSGAENVACQIINLVRESGISCVYCSFDGAIRNVLNERNIEFVPIRAMSVRELRKVIKSVKPNIIHAHDMRAGVTAAAACGDIPLISHIHNNNFDARRLSVKSILYYFAAMKASHILWVSKSAFKGYLFHKKLKHKSTVLYNVIDVESVRRKAQEDTENYSYDIIFLGRLTAQKNPQRLIRIISKVVKQLPETRVAIVGTGDLYSKTRQLAEKMNLLGNIEFLGFRKNPYKILRESKIMMMTSTFEGTPMAVLEAMALGVPVISTPTDGIADIVKNGETGFLSNDDEEIAEHIVKVVHNSGLYNQMRDASLDRVRKIVNIDRYRKIIVSTYNNACRRERSR